MIALKRSKLSSYLFSFNTHTTKFQFFLLPKPFTVAVLPLPIDPPPPPKPSSSSSSKTHHDCGGTSSWFSLADTFINRGRTSSAQSVIDRIISSSCSSLPDIFATIGFANSRGLTLNSDSYGMLIRRLVDSNQPHLAEELYICGIVSRGIEPIPCILNSMVLCYGKFGRLDDAVSHFEKLVSVRFDSSSSYWVSSYNVVLRGLCTEDRVPEAYRLFNRMCERGVYPSFSCYTILIDGLCSIGELDPAVNVFTKLKVSGSRPSFHLYKSVVYSLCRKHRVDEADSICREMEGCGFNPDRLMYTSIISGYCKEGRMKSAFHVFLRMLKLGCKPDAYTFNTLIYGLLESGHFEYGMKLIKWMSNIGLRPNLVTYSIFISKYCKYGKVDCGLKIFREYMFQPDVPPTTRSCTALVRSYTVLISTLHKEGRLVDAGDLFCEMLERNLNTDLVTFLSVIKMYPRGKALHLAGVILQRHIDHCLFSEIVDPPSSEVADEIAELWFNNMLNNNLYFANDILLAAMSADGRTKLARYCMNKMIAHGCEPFGLNYHSKIKCLCMLGEVSLTLEVLKEMDTRGLKPSVAIYDTIIGSLCSEKRFVEADNLFKKMIKSGVAADEVIYTTLINGYSKSKTPSDASYLFSQMIESGVQPSSHAYATLINGLIKSKMTLKGYYYLGRMIKDGFEPDNVLYTILINQFCRKGDVSFAFSLANLMDRKQISRNLITYGSLISGVCRNISADVRECHILDRRSEIAQKGIFNLLRGGQNVARVHNWKPKEKWLAITLQEMNEQGLKCDLHINNSILNLFCVACMIQDAYKHLSLMLENNLVPNKVTYTTLINGHIRIDDIDKAMELFNLMNTNGCVPDAVTYNTLIKGLCQTRRVNDALSLVHTMRKRGLFPSEVSYERLVYSLCTMTGEVSYNKLMKGCCWTRRVHTMPNRGLLLSRFSCMRNHNFCEDALKLCEEMLLRGYVPCRSNYNRVLHILCEQNKLHEAHKLIDMMLKRGKTPDDMIKKRVIEACHQQGEVDMARILGENILVYEVG